jgi:hypothetical protein
VETKLNRIKAVLSKNFDATDKDQIEWMVELSTNSRLLLKSLPVPQEKTRGRSRSRIPFRTSRSMNLLSSFLK